MQYRITMNNFNRSIFFSDEFLFLNTSLFSLFNCFKFRFYIFNPNKYICFNMPKYYHISANIQYSGTDNISTFTDIFPKLLLLVFGNLFSYYLFSNDGIFKNYPLIKGSFNLLLFGRNMYSLYRIFKH